jgi:hypothetical protein
MPRRFALALLVAIAAGAGAACAQADTMGPDYLASDNVEFVKAIKSPAGLTAGARVIGHYLYVTSSKDLEIFDISTPEDPKLVSSLAANIQFENEEVPTNGKLLGISSDLLNSGPDCLTAPPAGLPAAGGCLRLYDVRNPADIKELPSVPGAGDHTSTCVLDCSYFYGSAGTITDATTALTGGQAKIIGNWKDAVKAQGVSFQGSCHNLNEVRPGVLITSCQPFEVISVRPEDGGSILTPKVLTTGATPQEPKRFIHSAHWPRQGQDKFALIGGETNFKPQCGPTNGAFMTFDAGHVAQDGRFTQIDEIRPVNGSYLDSNPPAQILGCSVHWYEEHPTFHDGGLVALAEYENGTRFLQIQADGKIKEQGFFVPLGGSTSAPHWAPNSDIVYAVDYERGIDVLRYKGSHYVPGAPDAPGVVAGTEGRQPGTPATGSITAACASTAGFRAATAQGPEEGGPGLSFTVERRQAKPFSVDVFRQSAGRSVTGERRVAHFEGKTGSFSWNGRDRRGHRLGDGVYFARFTMLLDGGLHDVRRVTLSHRGGAFTGRAPFYLRDTCGALESFKLSRPVFGGRSGNGLGIAYRLTSGADSVTVEALRGRRVIRRFAATGAQAGRTYRLRLGLKGIPRGSDVRIRVRVVRANATTVSALTSRRL